MPIPSKNNELNRVSARQLVYNELKNWIVDGTMLAGEFINDSEIAKHFGVSRTPVREAILMLASQDLVKIIPSKGTQISPVSPQQAEYVFEAIGCIAKEIALLCVKKRTSGDILQLKKMNDGFAKAVRSGNSENASSFDRDFHNYMLKIADNPYLENCWMRLIPHAYRYENLYCKEGVDKNSSVVCHQNIVDAIEKRDIHKAAEFSAANWTEYFEKIILPRLKEEKDTQDFLLYHKYY